MYKRLLKNIRYKYKLLLSLIIVFFVPLFSTSTVFIHKVRTAEKENYINASKQLFQQSCYSVELVFDEIHHMAYYLLSNKSIRTVKQNISVSQELAVCQEISNYILNSRYLVELALYAPSKDTMYFSDGTAASNLYFNDIYQYENFNSNDFHSVINSMNQTTCLPSQSCKTKIMTRSLVTIAMPFSSNFFSTVFFAIDSANFSKLEQELLQDPSETLTIYYNQEQIYTSNKKSSERYENLENDSISSVNNLKTISTKDSLFLIYQEENSAVKIVLEKNMLAINQSTQSLSTIYVLLLTILSLVGCLIIMILWRDNYKPIKEVLTYTTSEKTGPINEFDCVKNTLISIKNEQNKLSHELINSIPAYRKQLLVNLIKGEYDSIEDFNHEAECADICFSAQDFFVLALSIATTDHSRIDNCTHILHEILSYSERNVPPYIRLFGFVDQINEKIIYIGSINLDSDSSLDEQLYILHKLLIEYFGFEHNIGVSNVYRDITKLDKAYMEALSALDYRIVYGSGKIIHFSQISINNYSHEWYPEELIHSFSISLKVKDEEKIHIILDEIMECLQHNNTPIYVAKYVCYDLMRNLADNLVITQAIPYKKTIGYHNIMNIARLYSFEEIAEVLHRNISFVFSFNNNDQNNIVNCEVKKQLEDFIEKNYTDYNFSMSSLLDEFNVSESTMRKTFKSVMQTSFIEYLSEKRIEKAKELLTTTKLPLNNIANQVGYLDTSSFIRRFKQKTGMPPGEYRIINECAE